MGQNTSAKPSPSLTDRAGFWLALAAVLVTLGGSGIGIAIPEYHPPWTSAWFITGVVLCGLASLSALWALVLHAAQAVSWRENYRIRLINWISGGIDRRMARFGRHYREHLLNELQLIDLKGLAPPLFTPTLDEVYIEVALAPRDPVKVPPSDLPPHLLDLPPAGQRQPIGAFLSSKHPRVLVVLGAPGSGKTTLLRHTARELFMRDDEDQSTPLLLYLRDHIATIITNPTVALPELMSSKLARYGLTEPPEWLERRLRDGGCVVMLDGLDEVARQEHRQAVSDWVGVQIIRYRDNDFVVTSRPLGYQSAPIEGAITLHTQPFKTEQVKRFLHGWFQAAEGHSLSAKGNERMVEPAAEADKVFTQLQGHPSLRQLMANPLLLTMIATVHQRYGELPGTRAELYEQICKALIFRRQAAKKLEIEPSGGQKERLMRVLAFEMMLRKTRDLTTKQAIAILGQAMEGLPAEDFLDDAASNGLFVERGNGDWTFAHSTFQEYLAAAHIKQNDLQAVLKEAVDDVWWHETTLLYIAGSDPGPIVKACLATNTLPALTLAFDCAEEGRELSGELQNRLQSLLAEGLAPDADPERRRLMIGVTVSRHLRHVIEAANGSRVCSRVITRHIYKFFLDDVAAQGPPRLPDAPAPIPTTSEDLAMTGIRASDAAAFVDWINAISGGQPTYRLPALAEIQDPVVRNSFTGQLDPTTHSIWLAPNSQEKVPQFYSWSGAAPSWLTTSSTIQQRLAADFSDAPLTLKLLPLAIRASVAAGLLDHRILTGDALAEAVDLVRNLDLARILECTADLARERNSASSLPLVRALRAVNACARTLIGGHPRPSQPKPVWVEEEDWGHYEIREYASGHWGYPPSPPDPDRDLADATDLALAVRNLNDDLAHLLTLAGARNLILNRIPSDSMSIPEVRNRPALLDRARLLALCIAYGRARDLHRAGKLGLDFADATIPGLQLEHTSRAAPELILGQAFSQTRARVANVDPPRRSEPPDNLLEPLVSAFCEVTRIGPTDYVALRITPPNYAIPPDELGDTVRSAIAGLRILLTDSNQPSTEWTRSMMALFETRSAAIIRREQQVTPPIASALRVLALCLAAEADVRSTSELGDDFRRIAVGITWLEQRHNGEDSPVETVVVALA